MPRCQLQAMILLPADVRVEVERADTGRPHRILQRQAASLVQVRIGRAHRVRPRTVGCIERARAQSEEHTRVERRLRPEPVGVAAQIARGHAPTGPQLPLERYVPLLRAW